MLVTFCTASASVDPQNLSVWQLFTSGRLSTPADAHGRACRVLRSRLPMTV